MKRLSLALLLMLGGTAAAAQQPAAPAATVVEIPPLTSPDSGTRGNEMLQIGWEATQLIASDLRQTTELMPLKPKREDYVSYPEVTAPSFGKWRPLGAKLLLTGFVQSRSDGRIAIGCYVYDVSKGTELARKGFVLPKSDWRRAAHKCSALAYTAVTGSPGMFDTRIAYVAESGAGDAKVRRIAFMDSDGANHKYLTSGKSIVLKPRLSPDASQLAYVSFETGKPAIKLLDVGSGQDRPLVPIDAMNFAPRFSPDGSQIAFSMMLGPNSDIYVVPARGGVPRRLTTSPAVDTDPSYSPDGSKMVFESDRSGSQQLYVMNADGSGERRISFGPGAYAAPEWSPDGQWIAFTSRNQYGRRIGIMKADGTGEVFLTNGPADESPTWAASSREIMFARLEQGGRSTLYRVNVNGGHPEQVTIPQDGSDPDWSGAMD
jgi:TolB protein